MSESAFNILGSQLVEEVLGSGGKPLSVKGRVVGINPVFVSDGEKEILLSDKAEWIVLDTADMSRGASSAEDMENEIEALSKFLKKGWARKVILISAPSLCPGADAAVSDAVCAELMDKVSCNLVVLPAAGPAGAVRRERAVEYLRSVIDVISTKYDRGAVDKLAIDYIRDIDSLPKAPEQDLGGLVSDYYDAVRSKKRVGACRACAKLAAMGDVGAISRSEASYMAAVRAGADRKTMVVLLKRFAAAGIPWAQYRFFDILWSKRSGARDAEMVECIRALAEKGDGHAEKRLGCAYRLGRGVEKDLEKALDLERDAFAQGVPESRFDLFDVLWDIGSPSDYDEMAALVKGHSDKGHPAAKVRMARLYRHGKGVKKDPAKALQMLEEVLPEKPGLAKEVEALRKAIAAAEKKKALAASEKKAPAKKKAPARSSSS